MTVIAPNRVLVLSVGIERYAYGGAMDLPGAAAQAARFARWALARGVPAERVLLGCTWLDAPDEPGGVTRVGTSRDEIEDALLRAGELDGDLLLAYWCGHGVLDDGRQRALFTSDASAANKRNVRLDNLMAYLASTKVRGYGQQVMFVDACANFVHDMRFDDSLPRTELPLGAPREVAQFVSYAAAQGQIAQYDRAEREATYSRTVLDWLDRHPGLPPVVDALARHVDDVFEALRAEGRLRQVPVYRRVRHYSGSETDVGVIPVAGALQASLRDSGLTVSQARRVGLAVAALPMLTGAAALEALGGEPGHDLVDLVAHRAAEGGLAPLWDVLAEQATTEADRLAVLQVSDYVNRQEWIAPAVRALQRVTAHQLRAAFFLVVRDEPRVPHDLDEALDIAASYGTRPAGVAPLHRLVTLLEHATGQRVEDDWYELPGDRLTALRTQAAEVPTDSARLVVDLYDPGAGFSSLVWPETVVGHLYLPGQGWSSPRLVASVPTLEGARAAVAELIDWTHRCGVAVFSLGLVLSRAGLDSVPEAWEFGDLLEEPRPLWHERPTVLHSAERIRTPKAQAWWRHRAEQIRTRLVHEMPEILWIEPMQRENVPGISAAVREALAACVGLAFAPGALCTDLRRDPLVALVAGGAPYVVWVDRDPPDWVRARERLRQLVTDGRFEDLPARLHDLRKTAGATLGDVVRVVWDAPEALPPMAQLTGMNQKGTG